jgi:nucleoside-diphosphate-sugar epimerase
MSASGWPGQGSLRDVRCVVTGGAGFIGSNLIPLLLERGARVLAVDNLERGRLEYLEPVRARIEFLERDLRERAECAGLFDGAEVVFHLASKVGGIGYYLGKPYEVLLESCRIDANVCEAALAAGVGRLLYASSAHVYPEQLQTTPDAPAIVESQAYPANPALTYGWAKLTGEQLLAAAAREGRALRASLPRLIGAYGRNQDIELATGSAIPVFVRRALEYPRVPFRVWGTGRETRSYCYVGDVVEALVRSVELLAAERVVGPFNLGSDGRVTIGELARQAVAVCGRDVPIEYDESKETVIWGQACDCSLAGRLLGGWRAATPLADGMREVADDVRRRLAREGGARR